MAAQKSPSTAGSSSHGQKANSRYDNEFPQFSPDDKHIVFASTRDDGDYEIYTMAADGTLAQRLTHTAGRDAHPYYFASGRKILFQSPRDHSNERDVDLYVMESNGKAQHRLMARDGFNGVPVPSRKGNRIAYMRGSWDDALKTFHWELLLVGVDGTNERQLTKNTWSSQVASWFPGDLEIAFYANPSGRDQLFVLNIDSGAVRPLLVDKANDYAPSVSPDGKQVAFTSDRDSESDLYILDVAPGTVTRLTTNAKVRGQPCWSRDARRFLFAGAATGVYEVYTIQVDGTNMTRLTHGTEGIR
jgi:TolB protein